MQIVDHLLRILDRRRLAATRKQLARTLHQLLLPAAAIATRALKAALCCFLFTPTSHASLDRSAFSLSHCPKNRSRRTSSSSGAATLLMLSGNQDMDHATRVARRMVDMLRS